MPPFRSATMTAWPISTPRITVSIRNNRVTVPPLTAPIRAGRRLHADLQPSRVCATSVIQRDQHGVIPGGRYAAVVLACSYDRWPRSQGRRVGLHASYTGQPYQ